MSQYQPPNQSWTPPPPPPSSPYPTEELARMAALVASETKTALILSVVGFFCFGFIFGLLAFRAANRALETIRIYNVGHEKYALAMTAKVLSIVDFVAWGIGLVVRIFLLK